MEKELTYKLALEKLIKIIFKLFLALIHNTSPNINEKIVELVDFSKEYKYLLNFGLLQLIVELSSDEKFSLFHSKYLLDLLNEQISTEHLKEIKTHFFDYYTYYQKDDFNIGTLKNNTFHSAKTFQKVLKKYSLLLKLMKNVSTKLYEEKHIGMILEKYVDIITEFDLFKLPQGIPYLNYRPSLMLNDQSMALIYRKSMMPVKSLKSLNTFESKTNNFYNMDYNSKIEYYRYAFVYYLIKITYRLIKKNQQMKQYITSLISLRRLINFIFDLAPPFNKDQITTIINNKHYRESKLFQKIQFYFKVKYIGCALILSLSKNLKEKSNYMSRSLDKYYFDLNEDLEYAINFNKQIDNHGKFVQKYSNYNKVYEKYRRHMYKYFFKGIYQLIFYYLSKVSDKFYKNYEDYKKTKMKYRKINKRCSKLYNELLNEKNKKAFHKLFNYIKLKEKEFKNVFENHHSNSSSDLNNNKIERRTLNYIKTIKQEYAGREENKMSTRCK